MAQAREHGILLESHDFLKIRLKDPAAFSAAIQQNSAPFVFTSVHAVSAVAAYDQQYPNTLAPKDCFCITGSTEAKARECGFKVLGHAVDASALARTIIDAGCKRVLHCSSANRREELAVGLTAGGVDLDYVEVYEKAAAPLKVDSFYGVLFYSPSQVDAFLELNGLSDGTPAFCIGATTAAHLTGRGHTNVFIAPQSSTESLLHTTYQYFNQD